MNYPRTEKNKIAQDLLDAKLGDNVTVETDRGYKLNRDITDISKDSPGAPYSRELFLGDPEGPHLIVYVDELVECNKPGIEYHVYALSLTDDEGSPVRDRGDVVKFWSWEE